MATNTVSITVEGEGHGLDYKALVGSIKYERLSQSGRLARLFLSDRLEPIVIDWEALPRAPLGTFFGEIKVVGMLKTGGDLEIKHAEHAQKWVKSLRSLCLASYRALIPVRSAGQHDSPLAGKVKILKADGRETTKLVPASQVVELDGKLFIPRWLAKEKLGDVKPGGAPRLPPEIEAALDLLEQSLSSHILKMQEIALPFQEAEILKAPLRAQRQEQERAMQAALAAQAAKQRAEEAARIKAAMEVKNAKSLARFSALPVLASEVCVRGHHWEKRSGQLIKTAWTIEKATVRTSGKRAYIFTDDPGTPVFFKPLDTIEIIQR